MTHLIPNRYHFVFGLEKQTEPFHLLHYLCLASCWHVNRPETIHFYYHYEPHGPYWEMIKPHLDLVRVPLNDLVSSFRYRDAALRPYRYAHQSDFIRLEKLVPEGGIYADMDTVFVRPLPPGLFHKPFVIGREAEVVNPNTQRSEPSLCNAMMMAAPGAEFGRRWLEGLEREFDGTWSNHSTLFPQRLAQQFPDLAHIEPPSSFYHFGLTRRGLSSLLDECRPIPESVYSIHLWAHLWWSRRRTDYSSRHAAQFTQHYIRTTDTTLNLAVRPFLPADDEPERYPRPTRVRKLAGHLERISAGARALAGIVVAPAIRVVKPDFGRPNLARSHWAHLRAQRRIPTRTHIESAILQSVIRWDEYNIFHESLDRDDVVIDLGAHIGAFSFACHWLGSRSIHAFEAWPDNYSRLEANLGDLKGVHLHQRAVFRSDQPCRELAHGGPMFANTGGGGVLFAHGAVDFPSQTAVLTPGPSDAGTLVPTIGLDEILSRFERVKLLKVDCEGSEFPILLTSSTLGKVERIVGEYHEVTEPLMDSLAPHARLDGIDAYRVNLIEEKLRVEGFRVKVSKSCEYIGLFDAVRIS